MELLPPFYQFIARHWRNEPMRKLKDRIRPIKHWLFGKQRIYKVVDIVKEWESKNNQEVLTVFDIGAAIGEATIPMAKAFPNAEIYCFEPSADSFVLLKKRTKFLGKRIHCFNYGLHNIEGNLTFYSAPGHRDGSSFLQRYSGKPGVNPVNTKVRRLDDVVKELNIKKIHFMKVDAEGSEKEIFEGGVNTLKNLVDNIFVEIVPLIKGIHKHDWIDTFEYLHEAGFSMVGIIEDFFFSKLVDDRFLKEMQSF
ncbi:MAG: FkbM family methyltransferase, partial [Candidatus Azambacteria bacterium]|nr:FkbM family methyltransferase [Candidatus Azambacteria bacterium]